MHAYRSRSYILLLLLSVTRDRPVFCLRDSFLFRQRVTSRPTAWTEPVAPLISQRTESGRGPATCSWKGRGGWQYMHGPVGGRQTDGRTQTAALQTFVWFQSTCTNRLSTVDGVLQPSIPVHITCLLIPFQFLPS